MAQLRGRERARYVADMFARISRRYDLMNTVMTAGRHYAWRRWACRLTVGSMSGPALDVAAGTCDFAFDLARNPAVTHVAALDFSPPMLHVAARKARRQGLAGTRSTWWWETPTRCLSKTTPSSAQRLDSAFATSSIGLWPSGNSRAWCGPEVAWPCWK